VLGALVLTGTHPTAAVVTAVIIYRVAGYWAPGAAGAATAAALAWRHPGRSAAWPVTSLRAQPSAEVATPATSREPPTPGRAAAATTPAMSGQWMSPAPGPQQGTAMPARPGDPAPAAAAPGRAVFRRWWSRYRQIVPAVVLLWAQDAVDKFRAGAQSAGMAHAPVINRASDALGGQPVVAMNHWLADHPLSAAAAAAYYIVLQALVTGTAGILLMRSGAAAFRLHRDALIATGVIGLVAFWAYPVAPTRMLPGYRDITAAAVPVFHRLLESKGRRPVRLLPVLARHLGAVGRGGSAEPAAPHLADHRLAYPVATSLDVLATANHYLLDPVTGPAHASTGLRDSRPHRDGPPPSDQARRPRASAPCMAQWSPDRIFHTHDCPIRVFAHEHQREQGRTP
jgi:hypothetical protein